MKVLQVNAVSGIRSTGRSCVEISDFLNKNGHEGFIAFAGGIPYAKGYKIGTAFEKKRHALYSRIFGMQAYFSKKGTRKLLAYIEELKPDVVHLQNLHSNFMNLEMLLGFLGENDIPTVITLNDCWFYTGKCTHYTIDNCYRWQSVCGNCPRLHKDNPSWFFDRTATMLRDKSVWFGKIPRLAVVGVSDWITNEARKSILSSAKIITRIYNWIDLDQFKPVNTDSIREKYTLRNKFVILGVASGWNNAKGLDNFIDLSRHLPSDMIILLVGKMQKGVQCPPNMINIDETHNISELTELYSLADVFVNLSLEESFGKTTAEALACGTPCIVLNSTANPELIGPGCGFILREHNAESVISAIKSILKPGKESFLDACRKYAKKNFNYETNVLETIRLYQDIIGQ